MKRALPAMMLFVSLAAACSSGDSSSTPSPTPLNLATPGPSANAVLQLSSNAFANDGRIPAEFTCKGKGTSPSLSWNGVPSQARELALVMEDPDAPGGGFVHWVVFHIDPKIKGFDTGSLPRGVRQAKGSSGKASYVGPCPPAGPAHHYAFTLSALSSPIGADDGAPAADVQARISSKLIAQGRLVGLFGDG